MSVPENGPGLQPERAAEHLISFRDATTVFYDRPPAFDVFAASFGISGTSCIHIMVIEPEFKDH